MRARRWVWPAFSLVSLRPLLLVRLDNLRLRLLRHRRVAHELHVERPLPLGRGAQVGRVPEHLAQGHLGGDEDAVVDLVRPENHASPPREPRDRGALELRGHIHLYLHDRLEDDRVRAKEPLPEGPAGGQLEGDLVGIHRVRLAVGEREADALNRVSRERALHQRLLEALLHGRDELGRDGVPDHLVGEDVRLLRVLLEGFHVSDHATVLARPPALLLVEVVELGPLREGLAVRDLWAPNLHRAAILSLQPLAVDIQMQLSHP
mmetsp:Transcript_47791/g.79158  ORF Transcript_47791/g.79158 Transcript_47791/m.79158 type:complete len:263 (-) Transcript_47791:1510-2298(-)